MNDPARRNLERSSSRLSPPGGNTGTVGYFILTVLGFSFWFFMVVPFASHRETYWWLAMVRSQPVSQAFGVISSTYRPLAQGVTWFAFRILNPNIFPTSVLHQALLQGFIYVMFVLAWWFIYTATTEKRLFAVTAFVAGGVFFSGYVHLFHIYGIFYIPVMLTLGAILRSYASNTFNKIQVWFAIIAILLVFWHPFATALFIGFYFGFYVDTFWQRSRAQHLQALLILLSGMVAIAAMAVLFARNPIPIHTRLFGFLVSYQTNEINRIASLVAFLLAQTVIFSMGLPRKARLAASLLVCALSIVFVSIHVPLLFLWIGTVLMKLFRLRYWSLFFLALAAVLLPFGGGIGTPMYAFFAIIIAVYVTPLGWSAAENALSFFKPPYVIAPIIASAIIILLVRAGIEVPIVTRSATPLLIERERTYQLENALAWLHDSDYCGDEIAFANNADDPIDSVQSALTRRNRPPASFDDVDLFWKTILECRDAESPGTATLTFGGPELGDSVPVLDIKGRYAGDAIIWINHSQK